MTVLPAEMADHEWLTTRANFNETKNLRAFKAVDDSGKIVGSIGFDNWGPNSAEVHFAAEDPRAMLRLLQPAAKYVFGDAKREYLLAMTPASKESAHKWKDWMGFVEVHRLRDGCGKGDDLVYSVLHRDNCKILNGG
jgi:hypothetical protein